MPEPILNPIGGSTLNVRTKRWEVCPGPGEVVMDVIAPVGHWKEPHYFLMLIDPPGSGASSSSWSIAMAIYLRDLGFKVRDAHRRCQSGPGLVKAVVLYGASPAFWHLTLAEYLRLLDVKPGDQIFDQRW